MKNKLNAKSVNDSERYSSNIVKERVYSSLNFLAGMEEDIVDDSAFQPPPQFLNYVEIWAVGRKKFQVQPGIFLKKSGQ